MSSSIKQLLPSVASQSPDLQDSCLCTEVPRELFSRIRGDKPQLAQAHTPFWERNDARFPTPCHPTPGADPFWPVCT